MLSYLFYPYNVYKSIREIAILLYLYANMTGLQKISEKTYKNFFQKKVKKVVDRPGKSGIM